MIGLLTRLAKPTSPETEMTGTDVGTVAQNFITYFGGAAGATSWPPRSWSFAGRQHRHGWPRGPVSRDSQTSPRCRHATRRSDNQAVRSAADGIVVSRHVHGAKGCMTRISSAGPCQHSWLSVPAHQRDWSDRRGHAAIRQTLAPCSKTMISSVSTSPLAGALPSVVAGWQESIFLPKNRYLCLVSNGITNALATANWATKRLLAMQKARWGGVWDFGGGDTSQRLMIQGFQERQVIEARAEQVRRNDRQPFLLGLVGHVRLRLTSGWDSGRGPPCRS
jgi:hypothetical protein